MAIAAIETEPRDDWPPLILAAARGSIAQVEQLSRAPDEINQRSPEGTSALMAAVFNYHVAVAELLIAKGADINSADGDGVTPLMLAASAGQIVPTKLLIDNGADINGADRDGVTALMLAAWGGHPRIVRLLIDNGADIDGADSDGVTPLMLAVWAGHIATAKVLIASGADANPAKDNSRTPLMLAAREGRADLVELLITSGADINQTDVAGNNDTPLILATREGRISVVKLLIESGADINQAANFGLTPLICAADKGHAAIAALLIDNGSDIDQVDDAGRSPLNYAAHRGHIDIAKLLIDKGATVSQVDDFDSTPLTYALQEGRTAIAELLIANGAAISREGRNALTQPVLARKVNDIGEGKTVSPKGESGSESNETQNIKDNNIDEMLGNIVNFHDFLKVKLNQLPSPRAAVNRHPKMGKTDILGEDELLSLYRSTSKATRLSVSELLISAATETTDRSKTELRAVSRRAKFEVQPGKDWYPPAVPLPEGLLWPAEQYNESPEYRRRDGIIHHLERVWKPIIASGTIDMALLRTFYPSTARAVDTYKNNDGKEPRNLPSDLDIRLVSAGSGRRRRPAAFEPAA